MADSPREWHCTAPRAPLGPAALWQLTRKILAPGCWLALHCSQLNPADWVLDGQHGWLFLMHWLRWCCLGWRWLSLLLWVRLGVQLRFWLQAGLHHQLAASSSPGSSASPLPFGFLLLPARGISQVSRVGHRMEDLPSCPEAAFLAPDCDHNPVHPSRSSSPPPQPCAAASSAHTRGQDLGHHLFSPSHTGVSCHPNYHLRNPPSISAHQYLQRPSAATTWRTSFPT